MPDKVIIEFATNTEGLEKAESALDKITQSGTEMGTEFKKNSDAINAGIKQQTTSLGALQKAEQDLIAIQKSSNQPEILKQVNQQLEKVRAEMKAAGSSADSLSKDFKRVKDAVNFEAGKKTLENFTKKINETVAGSQKLVTQLRGMKQTLNEMEIAGKGGTKAYNDMLRAAAKLEDQLGDTSRKIRALSSDTRNIDGVVSVVSGLAGAFSAVQGAAALLGGENEDLQKGLLKVQAAMALATGVQQVANTLQKESAAAVAISSAAQSAYAFVVGTSTGALKAFRIALAATGIGLIVLGIAALVENWDKLSEAIFGTAKAQKDFADAQKQSIELYAKEKVSLEILLDTAKNENLSRKTRNEAIAKLKAEYPSYLGFLSEENINSQKTADAVDRLNKALFTKAKLTAAEQKLVELYKKQLELQTDITASAPSLIQSTLNVFKSLGAFGSTGAFAANQIVTSVKNQAVALQEINPEITQFEALVASLSEEMDGLGGSPNAAIDKVTKSVDKLVASISKIPTGGVGSGIPGDVSRIPEVISAQTVEDFKTEIAQQGAEARFVIAQEEAQKKAELDQLLLNQSIAIGNQLFDFSSAINARKQSNLEAQLKSGVISEKKYAKEITELRRKQAAQDKTQAVFNAIIATALSVLNSSKIGFPQAIPFIIAASALGAAQLATIIAQPLPKFAKGTESVKGGTPGKDSVLAMLMPGERIVPAEINARLGNIKNQDLPNLNLIPAMPYISDSTMTAMEKARGMNSTGVSVDYVKLAKEVAKEMGAEFKKMKHTNVVFDKNGMEISVMEGNLKRTYWDDYYSYNG